MTRLSPRSRLHDHVAGRCALLLFLFAAPAASAQGRVPPLRLVTAAPAAAPSCASVAPRPLPTRADTAGARRLASEGTDAALLGDAATARAKLEEAVHRAPQLEDLEYQLARLYEEQGDANAAAASYCRYLALARTAADSAEARRRLEGLSASEEAAPSEAAAVRLRTGAAYARRGEFLAAASAFEQAIAQSPTWAEVHHDRAAALVAAGQLSQARVALERYLELRPGGPEATEVRRQLRTLARARYEPASALTFGVFPGGGQFYTGRPVLGALVGIVTASGVLLALNEEREPRIVTGVDPNGFPYQYETLVKTRPNLAVGVGVAVGATLLGALEAWWWSERGQSAAAQLSRETADALRETPRSSALRVTPVAGPTGGGIALSLRW